MSVGVIIFMAVITVASAVAEGILNSLGRMTEAQYLNFATKCGVVITALGIFTKAIQAIAGLGA